MIILAHQARTASLFALLTALSAPLAQAGTMTSSTQAPLVNGQDIANYGLISGADKWFVGSASKGQTFTTGSVPVIFKSLTYYIPPGRRTLNVKTYTVRVGKIVDSNFAPIYSEAFTQTIPWEGGEYMTWKFERPPALDANTTYAVEVGMNSSTSPWQTGIPYISMTGNLYAGGAALNLEDAKRQNSVSLDKNKDRIFHVDLQAASATTPDPESIGTVKDAASGSIPGLGMQVKRETGSKRAFEDMVLSGWKKSPLAPQVLERCVSSLFDDRSWVLAQEFNQLQVEPDKTVVFRKKFSLDAGAQAKMRRARLLLSPIADKGVVYLNGWKVGDCASNHQNSDLNLNGLLRVGDNVIVVVITNTGPSGNMARECLIIP